MLDKRIIEFISEHHVMSLACTANGDLWCASCFYLFLEDEMSFIITSEEETQMCIRDRYCAVPMKACG